MTKYATYNITDIIEAHKRYTDYGKLKKQMKEYGVIKSNVDSILKQPQAERTKGREPVFTKDGVTDYFLVWIMCGIPFGIWRVFSHNRL